MQKVRASGHCSVRIASRERAKDKTHCEVLWCQKNKKGSSELEPFVFLVGRAGLEPATNGLKVRCSTN